jgi:hypothetical protein
MALSPQQIGLLIQGIIKLIFCLVFMGLYIKRIIQLDKLASNTVESNRSLRVRVSCLVILIALGLIDIIVTFTDSDYYMSHYKQYSFINILCLGDYILQLYIITREHKKKTFRTRSVLVMWILMAIQDIATMVVI